MDYLEQIAEAITSSPAAAKVVALVTVSAVAADSVRVRLSGADEDTTVVGWSSAFQLAMSASDVTGRRAVVLMIDGQPWISDLSYGGTTT